MEVIIHNLVHFVLMIIVYYLASNGYLVALDVVRFIMVYFGISLVTSSIRYYLRRY